MSQRYCLSIHTQIMIGFERLNYECVQCIRMQLDVCVANDKMKHIQQLHTSKSITFYIFFFFFVNEVENLHGYSSPVNRDRRGLLDSYQLDTTPVFHSESRKSKNRNCILPLLNPTNLTLYTEQEYF